MTATPRLEGIFSPVLTPFVNPGAIVQLYRSWRQADADDQQHNLDAQRAAFQVGFAMPNAAALA